MRVELGADHDVAADDGAHPLQQVALAVVVAVGDHRAVQAEQHHVDRQRRAQIGKQLLAQRLVASACRRAARLSAGNQAFDQVPARRLAAQARRPQRPGEIEHVVRVSAGWVVAAVAERGHSGRHRCEGIGFGGDAAAEHAHGWVRSDQGADGACRSEVLDEARCSRAGESIVGVTPRALTCAGRGRPRTRAAQASPIAGDVWMP